MKKFDLIVVGAGILGTSHALQAARSGRSVLVLEKDNRPVNATVRNFGQAVPSGLSGKWHEYGRVGVNLYKEIQQKFDISVRPFGSVYVASDAEELEILHEAQSIFNDKDYPNELLSIEKTRAAYPYLRKEYVKGSLFFPDDVSVEPDRMIYQLLQYAQSEYGITYQPNTAVVDCIPTQDGVEIVTTGKQRFAGSKVVICSGDEFRLLFPETFANSGLVVSKLQMMQTNPIPIAMKGNILTGLTIRRYESFEECPSFAKLTVPEHYTDLKKWGIHILFKQALDGSIIVGDSHEYASATQTNDLGFDLKEHVNELMLAEAERIVDFRVRDLRTTWAGFYAQHKDDIFEHDLAENLHIVTGIGGKGMTSSLGYAEANIIKWGLD